MDKWETEQYLWLCLPFMCIFSPTTLSAGVEKAQDKQVASEEPGNIGEQNQKGGEKTKVGSRKYDQKHESETQTKTGHHEPLTQA